MRTAERNQWEYLSKKMAGRWDAQRHEDKYSTGIADVSYGLGGTDGWIELKTIAIWPKNPKTPVNIPHLTSDQVNWLENRGKAGGGAVFLLLAVGKEMKTAEWVLVRYPIIRAIYERALTKFDLLDTHGGVSFFRAAELDSVAFRQHLEWV